MGFEKGHKLAKGRPKGSKNEKTEQWEKFATWFMSGGLERLEEEMGKLEGKDFVMTVKDLLEYFKPKLARNEGEKDNITIIFNKVNYGDTDRSAIQVHAKELPATSSSSERQGNEKIVRAVASAER